MGFDPMRDVPTTEEEVMIALQREDDLLTKMLQGKYRIFVAQGKTLLEAYRLTLEAHAEAPGYNVLGSQDGE